jgi:hypothetical protein
MSRLAGFVNYYLCFTTYFTHFTCSQEALIWIQVDFGALCSNLAGTPRFWRMRMLTYSYADVCWRAAILRGHRGSDECWRMRMLTYAYADVCWHMLVQQSCGNTAVLTYVDVCFCWRMLLLTYAHVQQSCGDTAVHGTGSICWRVRVQQSCGDTAVLTYAGVCVCWRMLTYAYANVCWRAAILRGHRGTWRRKLTVTKNAQKRSTSILFQWWCGRC